MSPCSGSRFKNSQLLTLPPCPWPSTKARRRRGEMRANANDDDETRRIIRSAAMNGDAPWLQGRPSRFCSRSTGNKIADVCTLLRILYYPAFKFAVSNLQSSDPYTSSGNDGIFKIEHMPNSFSESRASLMYPESPQVSPQEFFTIQ